MKKRFVYISIVVLIVLIIVYLILNLIINIGHKFVNSIDGEKFNSNYSHIYGPYSLFRSERSICHEKDDEGLERVTLNVDSLSWDTNKIVGHSRGKYFLIIFSTNKIHYYESKKELLKQVEIIPEEVIVDLPPLDR